MKRECKVKVVNDKIVVTECGTSESGFKEGFNRLQSLNKNLMESEQQKVQLENQIKEKVLEKQLGLVVDNISYIKGLKSELDKALRPYLNDLIEKAGKKVGFLLKKYKFDRLKDGNEKTVLQARIMGEVASELGLDVNHSVLREVRSKFFPKK